MAKADKEIVLFQTQRTFNALCKAFLNILEGLQNEHQININKMHSALGPHYEDLIHMMDYFDDDKYSYLRKLVFDRGGEAHRDLQSEINKYDFTLIPESENEVKGNEKGYQK